MRIGLHHGQFVAGVIGSNQLRFDIWGEDCPIPLTCTQQDPCAYFRHVFTLLTVFPSNIAVVCFALGLLGMAV